MLKKVFSTVTAATLVVGAAYAAPIFAANSSNGQVASQVYDWNNVRIGAGGYIPGIIYNQTEKDLVYLRTDMGGAYRWDAAKKTWVQLMDFVSLEHCGIAGVESLATDPVETNRLYILTGSYNNEWATDNAILLRSTNKGKTFEQTVLPFKAGANMPGRDFGERLMIDPNDNKVLYLGTRGDDLHSGKGNGLWKSTDYGVTWKKVDSFPDEGQFKDYFGNAVGIGWIAFDASTGTKGNETNSIYVGVADKEGNNIYRSNDAGKTWGAVPGQPTGRFAHSAVIAKNGMMYVTYNSELGPFGGGTGDVYKYDTKKNVWTKISPADPLGSKADGIPFGGVAVDPNNPDTVMVTTMNLWWPDELIFRSTDAGKTWKQTWKLDYSKPNSKDKHYTLDYSKTPWLDWGNADNKTAEPKTGWMLGDLEVDPFNSDHVMWASGASVYGTANMSALDSDKTVSMSVYDSGIEQTAVRDLISTPTGANLLSAIGDVGGFRHEDLTKSPEMIENPKLGSGTDIDYAENNPDIIIHVGSASGNDARMGISTDNGKTWKPATNAWTPLTKEELDAKKEDSTEGNYAAISADGKTIVWSPNGKSYSGDERQVSFSKDMGQTWTISKGIPAAARVYSDRVNSDKFYGYKDGKFYVSTDGGANFTCTVESGIPVALTGSFKATPGVEGDIWIGCGKDKDKKANPYGLWHSTDSGKTFTKVTSIDAASSIGFGKAALGKDYVALYTNGIVNGVAGIFRSDDAGATWVRINDDLHQYANANSVITGDPRIYGRVYLGTDGFGIVYADIDQNVAATEEKFTDISDLDNEAKSAIRFAYNNKIAMGKGANTFAPKDDITREEFIKMLIGTLGIQVLPDNNINSPWYNKYLLAAEKAGLIDETQVDNFTPNKTITKQDMCVLLAYGMRISNKPVIATDASLLSKYKDADKIEDYSKADVASMVLQNIITADADGNLGVDQKVSREEAVKVLYRVYQNN